MIFKVSSNQTILWKCLWKNGLSEGWAVSCNPTGLHSGCWRIGHLQLWKLTLFFWEHMQTELKAQWTFPQVPDCEGWQKNYSAVSQNDSLEQIQADRLLQLWRYPTAARLAYGYIMAAEEVTGGATSWKVLFSLSLPFLNCLNDLLLNESALATLNTLPDLCCQKLSIKK